MRTFPSPGPARVTDKRAILSLRRSRMWKITVTQVYARSAHALIHGCVPVRDAVRVADDTLPGKPPASRGRRWLQVIDCGSHTLEAYWALGPHRASEEHHKLDISGRLLLIM